MLYGFDQHFQASVHFSQPGQSIILSNSEIIFLGRRESNQGLLGEKQECYLCAMLPPTTLGVLSSFQLATKMTQQVLITLVVLVTLVQIQMNRSQLLIPPIPDYRNPLPAHNCPGCYELPH